MRCPRCQKEVKAEDHYCPHCGYDLWRHQQPPVRSAPPKQKQLPIILIMVGVLLTGVAAYFLLDNESKTSTYTIGDYTPSSVTKELYAFTTLEDFQVKVANADKFIAPIQAYTESLEEMYGLTLTPSYAIRVSTDNNVDVTLHYATALDDQTTLSIHRHYDRTSLDDLTIKVTKSNCKDFEDLQQKEHEEILKKILGASLYKKLAADFADKASAFKQGSDKISHYGMGVYEKQKASMVIYRHDESFSSVVTRYEQGDGALRV